MRFSTHHCLRFATSAVLTVALIACTGCTTMRVVSVPATEPPSPHFIEPVYGVTTASGSEVTFDEPGEIRVQNVAVADLQQRSSLDADSATVNGTVSGAPYEIRLRDVEALSLKRPRVNKALTGGVVGGVLGWFVIMYVIFSAESP